MKINATQRLRATATGQRGKTKTSGSLITKKQLKDRAQAAKAPKALKAAPKANRSTSLVARSQKICAVELPRFRYIEDVSRYLDQMSQEIDELDGVIKIQQKSLAYLRRPRDNVKASIVNAATFEFDVSPDAGAKRSHLKRKIDPELTKVVVPNIKKLQEQYGLSEDLYEKHRTLEAIETQLAMQFPDKRGPAYEEAIGSLRKLKAKVADRLKDVLGFLNQVAAEHVPRTFKKYMDAIVKEVQEHVLFESNQVFLYVSTTPEGELAFTSYLMLQNATNDEGQVTPHLYISVQWVVGQSIHVQINHEYELPNQLMKDPGTEVGSVGEAVKAIAHLLDIEDFATALGTVPLATQLKMDPSKISEGMFTYRSFIDKVSVDADKLVFHLRKGTTEEQIDELKYPLYQEVKELFKNGRNTKVRMRINGTKEIEFSIINVAKQGEVNYGDAEFLKDKFGLNDSQLRKVVTILNQGQGQGE
jgi:hypothetical protein